DRHEGIELFQPSLELLALLRLIGRCIRETFSRVVALFLQLVRRRKELSILCWNPLPDVFLPDDCNPHRLKDLVAADMVEMVVRIDDELDRLRSYLLDLLDQLLSRLRRKK